MEQRLLSYYKDGNWKGILEMYSTQNCETFNNKLFLWIQPSKEDLKFIEQQLLALHIDVILSVGCGTGLLEWLIQCSTGIKAVGIEVDRQWWESPYAPPRFIQMLYADENKQLLFALDSAIMFCYFNNRTAFFDYMHCYKGNCLIIIGPGPGTKRHTDPTPFDPEVQKLGWMLSSSKEIQNTEDHIAIYVREYDKNN